MRHRIFGVVLMAALLTIPALVADATSVIARHSGNGAFVSTGISRAGFFGDTTDDTVSVGPSFAFAPITWPAVAEGTVQGTSSSVGLLSPDVGAGEVQGFVSTALTFGGPSSMDTVHFYTNVLASALSAEDAAGETQSAIIQVFGGVEFFIDPGFGGAAAGDYVGDFHLDPAAVVMTGAGASDPGVGTFLDISVSEMIADPPPFVDFTTIASTDGSTGLDVALFAGRGYRIDFMYGLSVPYGIDPGVEVNVSGSFSPATPVPEPATAGLLGLGLAGMVARNLGRRRAGTRRQR